MSQVGGRCTLPDVSSLRPVSRRCWRVCITVRRTSHRDLRAWRLGVLTFGHLLVDLYAGLFAPLLPAIAAHTHIPLGRLAILAGISGAVANGVQPPAGLAMHRFRRPIFLFLGPALTLLITGIGMPQTTTGKAQTTIRTDAVSGWYSGWGVSLP